MKKIVAMVAATILSSFAHAAGGGHLFGFHAGVGLPYVTQGGLDYVHSSRLFSVSLGYNALNLTVDDVSVGMTKTEISLKFHPFSGAFYVGAGIGQQTMFAKGTDTISSQEVEAKVEVKSSTLTPKLGWMWGADDGGFFGGIEFGVQNPSNAKSTVTTNADASIQATADYQQLIADSEEQAKKYGEESFSTLTLFRLGYLF